MCAHAHHQAVASNASLTIDYGRKSLENHCFKVVSVLIHCLNKVSNRYTVLSKVLKTQISTQEPRPKASKPNRGADSVQIMPRAKRFDGEAQKAEGKAWGEQGKLFRERSP